jgi:hypothetical protein
MQPVEGVRNGCKRLVPCACFHPAGCIQLVTDGWKQDVTHFQGVTDAWKQAAAGIGTAYRSPSPTSLPFAPRSTLNLEGLTAREAELQGHLWA